MTFWKFYCFFKKLFHRWNFFLIQVYEYKYFCLNILPFIDVFVFILWFVVTFGRDLLTCWSLGHHYIRHQCLPDPPLIDRCHPELVFVPTLQVCDCVFGGIYFLNLFPCLSVVLWQLHIVCLDHGSPVLTGRRPGQGHRVTQDVRDLDWSTGLLWCSWWGWKIDSFLKIYKINLPFYIFLAIQGTQLYFFAKYKIRNKFIKYCFEIPESINVIKANSKNFQKDLIYDQITLIHFFNLNT